MQYLKKILTNLDDNILNLEKKGINKDEILFIKNLYEKIKNLKQKTEADINQQKRLGNELKKAPNNKNYLIENLKILKENIQKQKKEINDLELSINKMILNIPNLLDKSIPFGKDEKENVVFKYIGEKKEFNFNPKNHYDLNCGIDFEKGVKLAGSRFSTLTDTTATLERALYNYMLDFNRSRGFVEWQVPILVKDYILEGTGQLPKFEDDLYKIEDENLYLLPTAEVALTNLFNDEILDKKELPLKLTAMTPCFRKEAGAAGRDTRGLIRQHQFNKVELVAITEPEKSEEIFGEMLYCASDLLTNLGLHHRMVMLCTGDTGFSASKTIDLEVWLPGEGVYREISSISTTKDFQAIRAKIRYKDDDGKNKFVHTLNGSSLAVGRTLLAIIENYQNEDGTFNIPDVLKEYIR